MPSNGRTVLGYNEVSTATRTVGIISYERGPHLSDRGHSGASIVPYTRGVSFVRTSAAVACVLAGVMGVVPRPAVAQSSIVVKGSDGKSVQWDEWIGGRGPTAVLLFSSWAPGSDATLSDLAAMERASTDRGWAFVVVVVQEPFEAAQTALGGRHDVPWFHDRHGTILKEYRVINVPALLIVNADGTVADRIEATPRALTTWQPEAERE
jgi:hypothetical protein